MDLGIAEIGGLIGDPVRAAMLAVLIDGRALPAGELAFVGNVAPQTASFHLSKLIDAGLISVERQGKHKYYRLANERVASAMEAMAAVAPVRHSVTSRAESRSESERIKELRFARSCYKHLAGRLAVELYRGLIARKLLFVTQEKENCLTDAGQRWCRELGILPAGSRSSSHHTGRVCLDWTERHHHLGGQLGIALFSWLKEAQWVVQNPDNRAVRLTHTGESKLQSQLAVKITRE